MSDTSLPDFEVPEEIMSSLGKVASLLSGWYPKFEFGSKEAIAWGVLLKDFDPADFVPAAMVWSVDHTDWSPTGPQFRQVVVQIERERRNGETRAANARIIAISKEVDKRRYESMPDRF